MIDSASIVRPEPRVRWAQLAMVFLALWAGTGLVLVRVQRYSGTLLFGWDGQFYYAAARSLVWDHDFDVTNDIALTPWTESFDLDRNGTLEQLPRTPDGRVENKYPIGLSLLEAPWLALGATLAQATGSERPGAPGYSATEVATVAIGLAMYSAAGLTILAMLLAEAYPLRWVVAGLIATVAGTQLLYYMAVFPMMAHAVAFAFVVTAVAVTSGMSPDRPLNARLAVLAVLLAFLFLLRPQQILLAIVLAPRVLQALRQRPAGWVPGALAGTAIAAALLALQGFVYARDFGHFTLNAYAQGGEAFTWLDPRLATFLVSAPQGLLVFSPVLIVATAGFVIQGWSRAPWPALAFAAHALIQLYVISCWWVPSQRMWCEATAAVAYGVAGWSVAPARWRVLGLATSAVAVSWTVLLTAAWVLGRLDSHSYDALARSAVAVIVR